MTMQKLKVKNLGPIKEADVTLGDLTILVGEQASGKSLFLQMMKLLLDKTHILNTLEKYNYVVNKSPENILTLYFGEGMSGVWTDETCIANMDTEICKKSSLLEKDGMDKESLFYIPAQRILSISDGRPKNFMEFDASTPYVLRTFSETLRLFFQSGLNADGVVFPAHEEMDTSFDESIFHGGRIVADESSGQKKMRMEIDGMSVPFMTWSAGQKEFMPLLMAFYCLYGHYSAVAPKEKYEYVVLEEPEMGLHPQAIKTIILQVLELIQMGYKVVISTHSPVFLEFAWAFNLLNSHVKEEKNEALLEMFDLSSARSIKDKLNSIFNKSVHTYYFARKSGKVHSLDITSLDAGDDNPDISEWGGISQFAGRVSEIVAKYMSADE